MKKLVLFPFIFLLASCSIMFQEELPKTGKPSREMIEKISYQQVMTGVFEPKCVACHGSSGGVNLETFAEARKHLSAIRQSALIEKRMPKSPYPALTKEEEMLLEAWIEAGGPDAPISQAPAPPGDSQPQHPPDGGGDHQPPQNPPPVPEPLQATYDSIRARIFVPKCLICHQPGGKAQNVPLLTKEDLLDSPLEIVIPGNSEESTLMIVIQEGARKLMPPKESGMAPLTKQQVEVIGKWISNGAKD